MIIKTETTLWQWKRNNGFWAEAAINSEKLTPEELDIADSKLEELYPDGTDENILNDIFRFNFEWLCCLIGISASEFCRRMNWDYDDLDNNIWQLE